MLVIFQANSKIIFKCFLLFFPGKNNSSSTNSTTVQQQQSKKVITNKTVLPPVVVKQEFGVATSNNSTNSQNSNSRNLEQSGASANKLQRLNNNIPSHLQDVPKKLPFAKKSPTPQIKSENGIKLEGRPFIPVSYAFYIELVKQ